MSHSWLYDRQDQLDGYKAFARIAYTLRRHVLPEDRDDIEMEIVLKLKAEADRHTEVTLGFLYAVARNVVRTYWRKKYREWRRFCRLYEGDKGEMIADGFRIILSDERVKAILVNIFGGILRCDVLAQGVVEAARKTRVNVPVVVRMEGTNVEEGRRILAESGLNLTSAVDLKDAAAKVAAIVK